MSELRIGETLFVSAAAGAVGSVVGQIAKIRGARAIGVAGSADKIAYVTKELGFDGCFNHRGDLAAGFREHAPKGVDVNFENVGGDVFWACYNAMSLHGRIIVCGGIAGYNGPGEHGPDKTMLLLGGMISKRLKMRGLLVSDWVNLREDFIRDVSGWIRSGQLKYREDVVDGLENTITAFQGLLQGANFGKLLVRVAHDPTR
jgi:NADPH-dependent curcumin reductase CurA